MSFEDRIAIQDVISAYSYYWDGQDPESFVNKVFTEDGLWQVQGMSASEPEVNLSSHQAILDFAVARLARRKGKFWSRHFQTNTVFDALSTTSARTRTMVLVSHQGVTDETPVPVLSGVYHDLWVKTPDGWRLKHRLLRHDGHTPHVTKS